VSVNCSQESKITQTYDVSLEIFLHCNADVFDPPPLFIFLDCK